MVVTHDLRGCMTMSSEECRFLADGLCHVEAAHVELTAADIAIHPRPWTDGLDQIGLKRVPLFLHAIHTDVSTMRLV